MRLSDKAMIAKSNFDGDAQTRFKQCIWVGMPLKEIGAIQGCQIFLGPNIPNWGKIYQMTTNYTIQA
jgi:hypothetical protein